MNLSSSIDSLPLFYLLLIIFLYQYLHEIHIYSQLKQSSTRQNLLLQYHKRMNSSSSVETLLNASSVVPSSPLLHPIYAILPEKRLSACVIPKNMSTVLVAILCLLFDPIQWKERGFSLTQDVNRSCDGRNELHRVSQLENLGASDWRNFIFVREPTERFLSGYLFMCSPGGAFGGNCFGCGDDVICVLRRLHEAAMAFTSGDLSAESNELWHLGPQIWHCEYINRSEFFQLVKYSPSRKEELKSVLEDMLSSVEPTTRQEILSEVFGKKTSHSTTGRSGREALLRQLESSEARELLRTIFYWDFVSFGFPFP